MDKKLKAEQEARSDNLAKARIDWAMREIDAENSDVSNVRGVVGRMISVGYRQTKEPPKFYFEHDQDQGLVDIYVNNQLFTTWSYEDDPKPAFEEFKKIYMAGYHATTNTI